MEKGFISLVVGVFVLCSFSSCGEGSKSTEGSAVSETLDDSENSKETEMPELLEYKVTDEGTIKITGCDENAESVVIPSEIDGKTVTEIDMYAFALCENMKSIEIPDTVIAIGSGAFCECSSLESIEIPDTVEETDTSFTFENCKDLSEIKLPDGLDIIGTSAFENCSSLKSITIPDTVTEIGGCAFSGCTGLESVKIPESVEIIGFCSFSDCTNLKTIEIPKSVIYFGERAFEGCENLTDVYYSGTEEKWNGFEFISNNDTEYAKELLNVNIHFEAVGE